MCTITFEINKASAVVDVWYDGKTASVELLHSKYKRRGRGYVVMQEVLRYADAFDLELVLEVAPFGDNNKLELAELKSWYMTLGFQLEGDNIMSRARKTDRETQVGVDAGRKLLTEGSTNA